MRRRRGIALVTIMLTLVVLTMLATSFVQLSRNGLLSSRQYHLRVQAQQACECGIDYARAKLAQVPLWAENGWTGNPTFSVGDLQVTESGSGPDDNLAEGRLTNGATFRLRAHSNLMGVGVVPPLAWSQSGINVPKRCALVRVEGEFKGVRREVEVVLARRSNVSGAIYAGQNFAVTTPGGDDALRFSSTVAHGNRLKVEGNVFFPDEEVVLFDESGGRGRVQSGQDTHVNSTVSFNPATGTITSASGTSLHSNSVLKGQVATTIQASIQTHEATAAPKFNPNQLVSSGAGSIPQIPPGHYHFEGPNNVTYTDENGNVRRDIVDAIPGVPVSFSNYRFLPIGEAEVAGNLTITGELTRQLYNSDGSLGAVETTSFPVSLGVGYNTNGIPLSAQQTPNNRLTVHGNVSIEGDLIGSGQLRVEKEAGQGGQLTLLGNSRLSATRTDGLALTTEGSVQFKEVGSDVDLTSFAMGVSDFTFFNQAADNFSSMASFVAPEWPSGSVNVDPNSALDDWRTLTSGAKGGVVGDSDEFGDRLRSSPITVSGGYDNFVKASLLSAGNTTHGQPFLGRLFEFPAPDGTTIFKNGNEIIGAFTSNLQEGEIGAGLTLGKHIRLREFIKSVDRGQPDLALVNLWNRTQFDLKNDEIRALVANQVSAYDQDARVDGKTLTQYFNETNPYQESMRQDFFFGGILHSAENLYARLNGPFVLLGAMMAEGDIGFDQMVKGDIVFDPSSFEDQFDLAKMGLRIAFYWSNP